MVGDGHAVGATAQILQHVFGATEGRFRVDRPVFAEQWPQPGSEGLGPSERSQVSMEGQSAVLTSKAPAALFPPLLLRLPPGGANQFPGGTCTR